MEDERCGRCGGWLMSGVMYVCVLDVVQSEDVLLGGSVVSICHILSLFG